MGRVRRWIQRCRSSNRGSCVASTREVERNSGEKPESPRLSLELFNVLRTYAEFAESQNPPLAGTSNAYKWKKGRIQKTNWLSSLDDAVAAVFNRYRAERAMWIGEDGGKWWAHTREIVIGEEAGGREKCLINLSSDQCVSKFITNWSISLLSCACMAVCRGRVWQTRRMPVCRTHTTLTYLLHVRNVHLRFMLASFFCFAPTMYLRTAESDNISHRHFLSPSSLSCFTVSWKRALLYTLANAKKYLIINWKTYNICTFIIPGCVRQTHVDCRLPAIDIPMPYVHFHIIYRATVRSWR